VSLDVFMARILEAARGGGASEFDLMTLKQLVLQRREYSTIELALQVEARERAMTGRDAKERREAVCTRLGISERRYYQLKKIISATPDCTPSS